MINYLRFVSMLNYVYISVIFINIHIKHEDKYTNIVIQQYNFGQYSPSVYNKYMYTLYKCLCLSPFGHTTLSLVYMCLLCIVFIYMIVQSSWCPLRAKQTSITSNGDPLGIFTIHTPAFHSLKLLLQLNL